MVVRINRTNGDTADLGTIFYDPSTANLLPDTEGFGFDETIRLSVSTVKDGDDAPCPGIDCLSYRAVTSPVWEAISAPHLLAILKTHGPMRGPSISR